MTDTLLAGVPQVAAYLGDILVTSATRKEHQQALHKIVTPLQKAGPTANRTECEFFKSSLEFLGH